MNVIYAKRRSSCVVCSMPIEVGEQIDYERHRGARHLTCIDRDNTARRNLYPMHCSLCDLRLLRGQGELEVVERQDPNGVWSRRWVAKCVDVGACDARIRAHV